MDARLSTSNKGSHSQWFYLKNNAGPNLSEHTLPEFTGRVVEVVLESWAKWGVPKKDVKKITGHLATIKILKENGVKGSSITGVYHTRRVEPLMAHALSLNWMTPGAPLKRTVLAEGPLTNFENHAAHQRGNGAHAGLIEGHPRLRVPGVEASPNVAGHRLC
jgi:hypothetical protein